MAVLKECVSSLSSFLDKYRYRFANRPVKLSYNREHLWCCITLKFPFQYIQCLVKFLEAVSILCPLFRS